MKTNRTAGGDRYLSELGVVQVARWLLDVYVVRLVLLVVRL